MNLQVLGKFFARHDLADLKSSVHGTPLFEQRRCKHSLRIAVRRSNNHNIRFGGGERNARAVALARLRFGALALADFIVCSSAGALFGDSRRGSSAAR
jgi:hypothetical protein